MKFNQQFWLNDIKKHVENRQKYQITRFHKKSVPIILLGAAVSFSSCLGILISSYWLWKGLLATGVVMIFMGGHFLFKMPTSPETQQDELAKAMENHPHLIPVLAPAAKDIQDNALLLSWYGELKQKIYSLDLSVQEERGLNKKFGEFFAGAGDDHVLVVDDEGVSESTKPSVLSSWRI